MKTLLILILCFSFNSYAGKFRLIEKHGEKIAGVSDFATKEEMDAWKAKLIEATPDALFDEQDLSAEEDAKKAKEASKKSFSFKGTTIAQLRQELNEFIELMKE